MVIRPLEIGGVNSDEEDDREEVNEESGMTSTYSSFTNRTRTERWGMEETRRFYHGLQQCGTDFTMMLTLFPGRTQKQLKNKFRKENKERPALVSKALNPKIAKPLNVDPYESSLGVEISLQPTSKKQREGMHVDPEAPRVVSDAAALPLAFDSTQDDESDLHLV